MIEMKLRKIYEFKPDPTEPTLRNILHLTKKQRWSLLKWALYSLMLVLLSLAQDVVMSRFTVLGASTDLVSCGIFLICLLQPPEAGGLFALIGSLLFYFSGSAPGVYSVALLTILPVLLNILRSSLLSKRFRSIFLCGSAGLMLYELMVLWMGLFFGNTIAERAPVFITTGILSVLVFPLLYPLAFLIGKIGGEAWKD